MKLKNWTRSISIMSFLFVFCFGLLTPSYRVTASVENSAIRYLNGFTSNTLYRNDDSSTSQVPIGFNINFFGNQHSTLFVNNNGNITFDSVQSTYTPYDLTSTTREIIAAFFADVDTRGAGSGLVTYGNDVVDGHQAFGVNYFDVGYYDYQFDKLNKFQLILIDRSDVQSGDFDIEFNYEKIQWETGDASGGVGGMGGSSARVGFSNGTRVRNTFFELPGSSVPGSFLDSNPVTSLVGNSFSSSTLGRYHFEARGGSISMNHNPLILVPGIGGSILSNDPEKDGTYREIWPRASSLITSLRDEHLYALALNKDGTGPQTSEAYQTTVKVDGIIAYDKSVPLFPQDAYGSTIDYITSHGYTLGNDFFVCPYDWRRAANDIASSSTLDQTLQKCIDAATGSDPNKKVDIIAHSMGGNVTRWYVSDPNRAKRVDHFVSIATPYLGAPKITQGVLGEVCFISIMNSPWCEPYKPTLHDLLQNFPSTYVLNPGPEYSQVYDGYIQTNWNYSSNKYNDGGKFNWLSPSQADQIVNSHNTTQFPYVREKYYGAAGSWNNSGGTNGVKVLMIVGSGKDTIVGVKQEYWGGWGGFYLGVNYKEIHDLSGGDGTVPLNSARMSNPGKVDLRNGVSTVYFNYEHGEIQKKPDVLQVALSYLQYSASPSSVNPSLNATNSPTSGPSLTPYLLDGERLSFDGNFLVEIYDSLGNRFGINSGNVYEMGIPNGSFDQSASSLSVFLPKDRTYSIRINGVEQTEGFVKIENISSSQLSRTDIYNPMNLTSSSKAAFSLDPAGLPQPISVDQNGDGIPDEMVNSIASISGTITDNEAPTVWAEKDNSGTTCQPGYTKISLNAVDNQGGTGVARIDFSIDKGGHILKYESPFCVNGSYMISARAVDYAGNFSTPTVVAYNGYIYLPSLQK